MTRHTSLRFAALGLLAGTIAIAPAAKAQITVTGGEASGQAAFFTPDTDPEENIRLFDINVQQLLIESENGTTSTSTFTPSAASFTDANANGVPDADDTGVLQGTLSGVAFTESGTPLPFTGAPTSLDFTLTSFDANIGTIGGSLIAADDPGDAPLIFLPGASDVNVITEGFSSLEGDLDIGDFEAALDDGEIGLPSSLQFIDGGSSPNPTPTPTTGITGRFQFDFKGENVTAGEDSDFDLDDDEIRFVGEANEEFRIRTAGETRGDLKLDIRAEVGAIDITLGGPFDQLRVDGSIDPEEPIDSYTIDGDAEGIFAFYNSSTYGFASTGENNTRFKFEQGDNQLRGRTNRDEGTVQFFAATGVTDLDDSFDFDDIDVDEVDVSEGSGSTCNACGSSIDFDVDDDGDIDDDDKFVFVPASFTTTVERSSQVAFISTTPISVNLFAPYTVNVSNTASYQYQFLTVYRFDDIDFDDDDFGSGTVSTIRVQQIRIDGTTYYCIFPRTGTATLITAYKQVGPTSRIFPGLAGLEEVSEEELEGVVLVGLEEIGEDVEVDDDTDDSDDDSTDDDGADDDADDDSTDGDDDGDDTDDDDSDDDGDDTDDDSDDDGDDTDDDTDDDSADDEGDDADDSDDDGDDTDDDTDDDSADDEGDDADDSTDDADDATLDDSGDDSTDDTDDSTDDSADDATDDGTDDTDDSTDDATDDGTDDVSDDTDAGATEGLSGIDGES